MGVVSRRDLASALADTLGLDVDRVADALDRRRISPAWAERLTHQPQRHAEDRGLLEREVWDDLTDGAEWPWGASSTGSDAHVAAALRWLAGAAGGVVSRVEISARARTDMRWVGTRCGVPSAVLRDECDAGRAVGDSEPCAQCDEPGCRAVVVATLRPCWIRIAAGEILALDLDGAPAPIAEWARDWRGQITPDAEHRGGDVWSDLLGALGVAPESDAADEIWTDLEREYAAIAEVEVAS